MSDKDKPDKGVSAPTIIDCTFEGVHSVGNLGGALNVDGAQGLKVGIVTAVGGGTPVTVRNSKDVEIGKVQHKP